MEAWVRCHVVEPVDALERIAHLLERSREPTYRVRAFRNAADAIRDMPRADLEARAATGKLRDLPGVGATTEAVIADALAGEVPGYLRRLESAAEEAANGPAAEAGRALRA